MILLFEQDTRKYNGRRWAWKPIVFRGEWNGGRTWRFGWGLWSLSFYPSPGLHDFMRYVESGRTEWRGGREPDATLTTAAP